MWNLADLTKSSRFHVKSTCKPYKSNNSRKTVQFYGVQWEGYVSWFTWNLLNFTKSARFHEISCEIRRISKDQLPGMVRPMFYVLMEHTWLNIERRTNHSGHLHVGWYTGNCFYSYTEVKLREFFFFRI